mgnify:CR=1 FL=1
MLYYLGKGTEFKKEECKEYKTIEGALRAAAKDEAFVVWDENGKVVGGLTDNVPEGALKTNPDGSVPAFDENGHPVGTVDAETAQRATGEGAETATDGQNGAEPEKSTPETENAGNGANTKPEKGGQDSGGGDGQQETQRATGEGAETATDGQNGAEPEKSTPDTETDENGANTEPEESKTIIPQGTMRVTVICDGTLNLRRSADWGSENICGRASRGQSYYVKAIHTVQGKKMVQTIDDIYLSGQSEHVQFEQL